MKRFLHSLFFLCAVGLWSYDVAGMQQEQTSDLGVFIRQYAVDHVLGYKTANLMVLRDRVAGDPELQRALATSGYSVTVPEFVGVSSADAQKFINLDIPAQWQALDAHRATPAVFAQKAEAVADAVAHAPLNPFRVEALEKFLAGAQSKGWRLGVRSTGLNEDTDEIANAGGNESEMNICPDLPHVNAAMQKVIASYLRPKSLIQRLHAGDLHIIDLPATPVLIQRMIGEQPNGAADPLDIPVGCVVHTQEKYGNTPGIVVIQASFGHNAGVVDSKVGIDTYYVDGHHNVFPIIKNKPQRMVPTGDGVTYGPGFKENPAALQQTPCLDSSDARAIKCVVDAIVRCYGKAMDIELVFDRRNKIISLVQARPLKLVQPHPSYIQSLDGLEVVPGSTVVSADASVRSITVRSQVVVGQTLEAAAAMFDDPTFARSGVKVVLVAGHAESTSHAATTFSNAGIPVVVVQDLPKVKAWLDQATVSLFIDVQRGVVVKAPAAQMTAGFFKHPMPMCLSVLPVPAVPAQTHVNHFPADTDDALFEKLKAGASAIAAQALDTLLFRIKAQMDAATRLEQSSPNKRVLARNAVVALGNLYVQALGLAQAMQPHLSRTARDITRLFYVNFFEAVYRQSPACGCVATPSVCAIKGAFDKQSSFVDRQLRRLSSNIAQKFFSDPQLFSCAFDGYSAAFVELLGQKWIEFLAALASNDENLVAIRRLFDVLHSCDMVSPFINFYFNKHRSEPPQTVLRGLCTELDLPATAEFLQALARKRADLASFDFSVWEDPKSFDEQLHLFDQNYVQFFTSPALMSVFTGQRPLAQLAAQSVMEKFVEVFDASIKTLERSALYPSDNLVKVANFKAMLQLYVKVFEVWIALGCVDDKDKQARCVLNIEETLHKLPGDADQLLPRPTFNVSELVWGSCFGGLWPERAEEVFMLVHQNLLSVLGLLKKHAYCSNRLAELLLPSLFDELHKKLLSTIEQLSSINKQQAASLYQQSPSISTCFCGKEIRACYNLPLCQHSAFFELVYNGASNTADLTINFLGDKAGYSRWHYIGALALSGSVSRLHAPDVQIVHQGTSRVSLVYHITPQSDCKYLVQDIKDFVKLTFSDLSAGLLPLPRNAKQLSSLANKMLKNVPTNENLPHIFEALFKSHKKSACDLLEKAQKVYPPDVLACVYPVVIYHGCSQFYEAALQSAMGAIDEYNTFNALVILQALAKLQPYQERILQFADRCNGAELCNDKNIGLTCYRYLVDGRYVPAYARALAAVLRPSDDPDFACSGDVKLFDALADVGLGMDKILPIAKKMFAFQGSDSRTAYAQAFGLELCTILIKKGPEQYLPDVWQLLQQGMEAKGTEDSAFIPRLVALNGLVALAQRTSRYLDESLKLAESLLKDGACSGDAEDCLKEILKEKKKECFMHHLDELLRVD